MHQLGTFGAVDPAVVALQHPVVLLIGTSGKAIPVTRMGSRAFVVPAQDRPPEGEQGHQGRLPRESTR